VLYQVLGYIIKISEFGFKNSACYIISQKYKDPFFSFCKQKKNT